MKRHANGRKIDDPSKKLRIRLRTGSRLGKLVSHAGESRNASNVGRNRNLLMENNLYRRYELTFLRQQALSFQKPVLTFRIFLGFRGDFDESAGCTCTREFVLVDSCPSSSAKFSEREKASTGPRADLYRRVRDSTHRPGNQSLRSNLVHRFGAGVSHISYVEQVVSRVARQPSRTDSGPPSRCF